MAQPSNSQVHYDSVLTNVSLAYVQSAANYVAPRVFPLVPVAHQSDKYRTWAKNDWLRDEAKKRAPNTESEGGGFTLSTDSYYADVYAIHKDISNQELANEDADIGLETAAAKWTAQQLMTRMERDFATACFATSIWGTSATPGTLWDDGASDPVTDIETGIETVLANTGQRVNTAVIGAKAWRYLKNHPDLVDRFKYTSGESITEELVARFLGIDRLFVMRAIYATNVEGETAAYSFIGGNHMALLHVAPNPAKETPSAGYGYSWNGASYGSPTAIGTRRIEDEKKDNIRIESQMAWDFKVVATDLGYFLESVVS